MIVGERKPFGEIQGLLGRYNNILLVGCGSCVKVLSGYARIDLRLTPAGELYVLEANPNPGIARDEDSTLSARKAGIGYKDFIQFLVRLGLSAHARAPG